MKLNDKLPSVNQSINLYCAKNSENY